MKKRGITTIFIIIAILIVVSAIGLTYVQKAKAEKFFATPENQDLTNKLNEQVNNCIEMSISSSLNTIGNQGGYFQKPGNKKYYEEDNNFFSYYFYEGQIYNPSKQQVEKELQKAFKSQLNDCINLIEIEQLEIDPQDPEPKISINKQQVSFEPNLPINIKSQGYAINMNFNEKISKDSALDDMINLALFMSQSRLENPGMDCISCLAEQAEQTNLYIDVYNFNEDSVIVGIYENFTESKQTLIYLNKYLE